MQRVLLTFMLSWMLASVAVASEGTGALAEPVPPRPSDMISSPSEELGLTFSPRDRASRKAKQLLDALPKGAPEGVRKAPLQQLNP